MESPVDISRVDLNLLVYLDVLLRERNVTKAANHLGITQPAMSNGLRRLRDLFGDPLLVRTSEGMTATERARELQPLVRGILSNIEQAVQEKTPFAAHDSQRVFRIMASDYAESCLMPRVLRRIRQEAPHVTLDVLTPSDVSFQDVEQGRLDMAINRFDKIPQSFHQKTLWTEYFACLMNAGNTILKQPFTLDTYLEASHIWVSKTGFGGCSVAVGRRGGRHRLWYSRGHYQVATLRDEQHDRPATLPSRAACMQRENSAQVANVPPCQALPLERKIAWSPQLQHNTDH